MRTHQYTWYQDTLELKSIIDYNIDRQNSELKFQDVRVFRGMSVWSDHYLVNAEILLSYGKNNTTTLRENITDCASELLQSPLYDIDSLIGRKYQILYKKRLDEKLEVI
jgi:hypothetical protein